MSVHKFFIHIGQSQLASFHGFILVSHQPQFLCLGRNCICSLFLYLSLDRLIFTYFSVLIFKVFSDNIWVTRSLQHSLITLTAFSEDYILFTKVFKLLSVNSVFLSIFSLLNQLLTENLRLFLHFMQTIIRAFLCHGLYRL